MKLRCPKCRLSDQLRISGIPRQPLVAVCNGCGCRFRVEYLTEEPGDLTEDKLLHCARCDRRQSIATHCSACGHEFTGYLRVSCLDAGINQPDDRSRQTGAPSTTQAVDLVTGIIERIRKSPRLIACLALAAVVITAVTFAYNRAAAEKRFLTNYVTTLYGINAGVELSGRIYCGSSAPPAIEGEARSGSEPETEEGQEELLTVREEVDSFMRKLDKPPQEYRTATIKLHALYELYGRFHTLAVENLSQPQQATDRCEELRNQYSATLAEIKRDIHPKLAKELKSAGTRYNLKFMQ